MDAQIKRRVQSLKLKYKAVPQPELLITIPNPSPNPDYEEEIITSEFTTLCPLNPGQPDYARLSIKFVPDKKIIELKSLKFYLTSYRMAEIFFEEATNRVLNDLVAAIKPKRMDIVAEWNVRGGILTRVSVSYSKKR
ncbi:MAG TPA: preQ(1) synthase [Dehalococcoidia bacterium]|jgi:7-cyano-7-deazaguanine reductase